MNQYQRVCGHPSDINEHLPTLRHYAAACEHVTEFGVRTVVSTWAFLDAAIGGTLKTIRSYDIEVHSNIHEAAVWAAEHKIDFKFVKEDTRLCEIEPTDLLFIDTLHTYDQLRAELAKHACKARRYLAFHDVVTFGFRDYGEKQSRPGAGLLPAIFEFLTLNNEWMVAHWNPRNNGLLILCRNTPA